MLRIIPKKDLKVINPSTMKHLPSDGIVIQKLDDFWKRRLNDGDITVDDLSKNKKKTVTTPQTNEKVK